MEIHLNESFNLRLKIFDMFLMRFDRGFNTMLFDSNTFIIVHLFQSQSSKFTFDQLDLGQLFSRTNVLRFSFFY